MNVEEFGRTPDGQPVTRLKIADGGMTASIMTWGAAIQDLRIAGHPSPLVLGFESFDHYFAHSPYFGAIVGRYANRIHGGRFTIDGEHFQADTNFLGRHTLHGGAEGFDRRNWTLEDADADFVTLSRLSEAGEMGFPGNLRARCTYRLHSGGRLAVELTAETDTPTLCNLAHHSYFNLENGGRSSILDHRLEVRAGAYLPVDGELIPTGQVVPVESTGFDFRIARPIGAEPPRAYDHNFCAAAARGPLARMAWVQAPSGVEMEVWSTEPGLQFYDGAGTARPVPGLDGIAYRAHAGFCLEPQIWPDSPNRPYFPQAVLRPGETSRQITEYRFRTGS